MSSRRRTIALGTLAALAGTAGWLGVLAARWDRVENGTFAVLVVLMLAAGYRAWFAGSARARDFWYGFALFGLFHLLSPSGGPRQPLMAAGVDWAGDLALVRTDEYGNPLTEDQNGLKVRPTRLGAALGPVRITRNGSPNLSCQQYVRSVTKLFASLVFGAIGGMMALHLGRRCAAEEPATVGRSRVPRLGMLAMMLVAGLAGVTFVINSRPDLVQRGWFYPCPGCDAGQFAFYQVEGVIVLFAMLEARFDGTATRAWWLGFGLFGGVYLIESLNWVNDLLPTSWLPSLYQSVLSRLLMPEADATVYMRGVYASDYATKDLFQRAYTWAPLLGFLAVAWVGSGVARVVAWGAAKASREEHRGRRSSIARLMAGVAAIGFVMAAARGTSPAWITALGDLLLASFAGAALWAGLGRSVGRAWWFGFALAGGVDFLLGFTRGATNTMMPISATPWPPHEALERAYIAFYERSAGRSIPLTGMFGDLSPKDRAISDAYHHARTVFLMGASLPAGWLGAGIARYLDRRRRGSATAGDGD